MKRSALLFSASIAIASLLFSCTKPSQPSTPYTQLYGTWKIKQEAFDDTNTGSLDSNIINNLAANDVESISFNKDSTGTHHILINGVNNDYNFKWSLIDNYSSIQMVSFGGDTLTSKILSLYSTNLTLMNYTTPKLSWYLLQR